MLSILAICAISPILPYVGIPGGAIFIVVLTMVAFLLRNDRPISYSFIFAITLILSISFIPAIYQTSLQILTTPVYFLYSLLIISLFAKNEFERFTKFYTIFIIILLIGALVSLTYKVLGGEALLYFENPDGRKNYVVPFTFSNSVWQNFIRPAGIFDEPGAFSFFVCSAVTIRTLLKHNSNISFWILVVGLITFSLAHIIFLVTFILSHREHTIKWCVYIAIVLLGLFLILIAVGAFDIFYNVFLIRFEITDGGRLHGDNRSRLFFNTLHILNSDIALMITGLSDELRNNPSSFFMVYGENMETGANPLNMLLKLGAMSLFYYITLIYLFFQGVVRGRSGAFLIGFGALLLQRDYIFVISYAFVVSMIIVLTYREKENY